MEDMENIKILYENKIYEINEQQLDRVIALASKQLRHSLNGQLDLKTFSILRGMEKETVKVFKNEHASFLYQEMSPELIYAIEYGLLDEYEKKKEVKKKEEKKKKILITQHFPRGMTSTKIKILPLTSSVWNLRTAQDRIFRVNLD